MVKSVITLIEIFLRINFLRYQLKFSMNRRKLLFYFHLKNLFLKLQKELTYPVRFTEKWYNESKKTMQIENQLSNLTKFAIYKFTKAYTFHVAFKDLKIAMKK